MTATVAGIHLGLDTHANRPAANTVPDGALYSCSDHGLVYKSNYAGNSWATWRASTAVTEILDIPTTETDDTLVLAPDGAGGVEFRAEAGGGGGITHTYLGTSTIGGTAVTVTQDDAHTKAITVPSGGGLLTSIELYVKTNAANVGFAWAAMLYDDNGSGKPVHLLQAVFTPSWVLNMYRVSGVAGDARWVSLPVGRFLPAGTFHIGFEIKSSAGNHNVYYDAGSDWRWGKGGNTFLSDAPDTSGTVYTLVNSTRDYSLRAGLLT